MRAQVLLLLALLAPAASARENEGAPASSTATLAAAPVPSPGPELRAGRVQVFGSQDYLGSTNFLDASVSSWSAHLGFRDYKIGSSTGTFYTFSGRAGWSGRRLFGGVSGEFTPRSQGYRSRAFGADLGWAWRPPAREGAVRVVALRGSVERISHSTDLPTTKNQPVAITDLGQSDVAGNAGVIVWNASFAAGFKKSVYNLDGADLTQTTSRVLVLTNFDPVVAGLPQDEWWLRASLEKVLWGLTPKISWTRTTYKADTQRPTVAAQAGLSRDFDGWGLSAFYARLSEGGRTDRQFAGVGADVKLR